MINWYTECGVEEHVHIYPRFYRRVQRPIAEVCMQWEMQHGKRAVVSRDENELHKAKAHPSIT